VLGHEAASTKELRIENVFRYAHQYERAIKLNALGGSISSR
jgi:D-xylulose reductase